MNMESADIFSGDNYRASADTVSMNTRPHRFCKSIVTVKMSFSLQDKDDNYCVEKCMVTGKLVIVIFFYKVKDGEGGNYSFDLVTLVLLSDSFNSLWPNNVVKYHKSLSTISMEILHHWYNYLIATQWYQFHTTDTWWVSLNIVRVF